MGRAKDPSPSSCCWFRRHISGLKARPAARHTPRRLLSSHCTTLKQQRGTERLNYRVQGGTCLCYDLRHQVVPYTEAWRWQQELVAGMLLEPAGSLGSVLLLQHPPVLTLGAGSTETNLKFDPEHPPLPLHRTERGGEVTYHGPGQLVMYPILDLQRFTPDLHWYLRSLEEVVIMALQQVSGLRAERCEGLTGVWVNGSKIAAIGIRARRWVTYHGLALNVTTDLQPYSHIVPCGIADKPVTSVREMLCRNETCAISMSLQDERLIDDYAQGLLDAFQTVFDIHLTSVNSPPVCTL